MRHWGLAQWAAIRVRIEEGAIAKCKRLQKARSDNFKNYVQEESLAGAYHAIRDPLANPVGAIAKSQAYTITDTLILQGALHFEVQDPAGLAEGIVLHHWESGFSSRIKEVNGNMVRLERAVPEGMDGPNVGRNH